MGSDTKMIHVVHLIGSTGLYGAERWIFALIRALDPQQIQSSLINLIDNKDESSEVVLAARERGVDAFDYYTGGRLNLFSVFRMAQWLRKNKIQVVHGHGFKSDMFALIAGRIAGCKVLTTPHGWSVEGDFKLHVYEVVDRFLYRFMDMICPLSMSLEAGLEKTVDSAKLRLILNGVDVNEVQSAVVSNHVQGHEGIIGYVGRLVPLKDLPTLLSSFKAIASERPTVRLLIVGDGPERSLLESIASKLNLADQVDFLGFKADAVSCLGAFDVFVLPSLSEGIPRCVMEAMAASVPVVVSDIPGCRALVDHGQTGLLFNTSDHVDLAEKIEFVFDNPDKAKNMAAAGVKKITEEYSNTRMAEEYSEVYKQLVCGG